MIDFAPLMAGVATVGMVAVSEAFDQVGGIAADGGRLGLIAGGMFIAYRVTSKAHRDAVDLYREASADAAERLARERLEAAAYLEREREEWARREVALLAQLGYRETPPPSG